MTIASRPRPLPEIRSALLARAQRVLVAVLTLAATAAAGALGVLLAPILDRIIISAAAVVLVAVLVVVVIDFFRSPD